MDRELTPNEARHIAALHADMAFALDCPVEQVEEKIAECCRTYGILNTQEALSRAIALGVKVEFAGNKDAALTIGTSHMDENALAAFQHQMTSYGAGYLYQDVPRRRGPFYTTAKYSKRGKKRK